MLSGSLDYSNIGEIKALCKNCFYKKFIKKKRGKMKYLISQKTLNNNFILSFPKDSDVINWAENLPLKPLSIKEVCHKKNSTETFYRKIFFRKKP